MIIKVNASSCVQCWSGFTPEVITGSWSLCWSLPVIMSDCWSKPDSWSDFWSKSDPWSDSWSDSWRSKYGFCSDCWSLNT